MLERLADLGFDPSQVFFVELKRRNVYKVAIAYAVVAWLLIQIATQVFPFPGTRIRRYIGSDSRSQKVTNGAAR